MKSAYEEMQDAIIKSSININDLIANPLLFIIQPRGYGRKVWEDKHEIKRTKTKRT